VAATPILAHTLIFLATGTWHWRGRRRRALGWGPRQGCHTSCPSCKQKQDPEAKPGPLAAIHMLRTQLAPCLGSETPETSRQWENEKKPWAHRLHASTALCQGLRRSCGFDISMRLSWAAAEALFFSAASDARTFETVVALHLSMGGPRCVPRSGWFDPDSAAIVPAAPGHDKGIC